MDMEGFIAENLNCSSQKANSKEYEKNYDEINWEDKENG